MADHIRQRPHRRGRNRNAGGHGFQRRHGQAFRPRRHEQRPICGQMRAGRVSTPWNRTCPPCHRLQFGPHGAVAEHLERHGGRLPARCGRTDPAPFPGSDGRQSPLSAPRAEAAGRQARRRNCRSPPWGGQARGNQRADGDAAGEARGGLVEALVEGDGKRPALSCMEGGHAGNARRGARRAPRECRPYSRGCAPARADPPSAGPAGWRTARPAPRTARPHRPVAEPRIVAMGREQHHPRGRPAAMRASARRRTWVSMPPTPPESTSCHTSPVTPAPAPALPERHSGSKGL